MKPIFFFLIAFCVVLPGAIPANAATLAGGTLIKASGSAVYYYANDGKRYVFPNEKTYKTWYADFSGVVTITDAELAAIQIGGNVTYRPESRLIKITTDPKVYAVYGTTLRWIGNEAIASILFGSSWADRVDDLPDPFFTNYTVGMPITTSADIPSATVDPSLVTIQWVLDDVKPFSLPFGTDAEQYAALVLGSGAAAYQASKPMGVSRVRFGSGPDFDIAPDGVSASVFMLAAPGWDVGSIEDEHLFYLEVPRYASWDAAQPSHSDYYGPFQAKLAHLIE